MSNPVGEDRHKVGTRGMHMGELTVEAMRHLVVGRQDIGRANWDHGNSNTMGAI